MNQIIIDGTDFHAEKMFVLIECLTYSGSAFGVNEKGEGVFFNARIIKKMKLITDKHGLLMPKIGGKVIAPALASRIPSKENTGAQWYSKSDKRIAFESGDTTYVAAGVNTLFDAIKNSQQGDILELKISIRSA